MDGFPEYDHRIDDLNDGTKKLNIHQSVGTQLIQSPHYAQTHGHPQGHFTFPDQAQVGNQSGMTAILKRPVPAARTKNVRTEISPRDDMTNIYDRLWQHTEQLPNVQPATQIGANEPNARYSHPHFSAYSQNVGGQPYIQNATQRYPQPVISNIPTSTKQFPASSQNVGQLPYFQNPAQHFTQPATTNILTSNEHFSPSLQNVGQPPYILQNHGQHFTRPTTSNIPTSIEHLSAPLQTSERPTHRPRVIPSSADQLSVSQRPIQSTLKDIIQSYRQNIENLILRNATPNEKLVLVNELFNVNCPFGYKYEELDIVTILSSNQHCELSKIPAAFNILDKYATNLLKPVEQRHLSWHSVQFASNAFQMKVSFLKGGLDILNSLGYTKDIINNNGIIVGLKFADNTEPIKRHVLNIAIDLTIAKFEVEAILSANHPNFEQLLYTQILPEVYFQTGAYSRNKTTSGARYDSLTDGATITFALNKPSLPENSLQTDIQPILPAKAPKRNSMILEQPSNRDEISQKRSHSLDDVITPIASSTENQIYCTNCGKQCSNTANFCQICGNNLKTELKVNSLGNEKQTVQPTPTVTEQANSDDDTWQCQHCTYLNSSDRKICEMCDKTSWRGISKDPKPKSADNQQKKQFTLINNIVEVDTPNQQNVDMTPKIPQQGKDMFQTAPLQSLTSPFEQKDVGGYVLIDPKAPENTPSTTINRASMFQTAPLTFHQSPMQQQDEFPKSLQPSATSPVQEGLKQKELEIKRNIEEKRRLEEQSRQAAIAQQNEMKENSHRIVLLLKFAENNGFTVDECYLAMITLKVKTEQSIKAWLENDFPKLINDLVNLCAELFGQDQSIGLISFNEAKKYLIDCEGIKETAVQKFIEERRKIVINMMGNYKQFNGKDIIDALHTADGDEEKAVKILQNIALEKFRKRIYEPSNHDDIYKRLKNQTVSHKVKLRMLMAEYGLSKGRAGNCIKLIIQNKYEVEDCIAAASSMIYLHQCERYLENECETCYSLYPQNKIIVSISCQCRICYECFTNHVTVTLKEKHIRHLVCPVCQLPNLDGPLPANYFDTFTQLIVHFHKMGLLPVNLLETFEIKLRDFSLLKDEKFRWCNECGNGFLWENDENQIKMTCNRCHAQACFLCKEKWEDQHVGITCVQFKAWREANDPALQLSGVADLLAKNALECPDCHFKYQLARGGCIHFTCSQCGYQFCNGCDQPFRNNPGTAGLCARHPRDCLYYLRDRDVAELQKLLLDNKIQCDTDIPDDKKVSDNEELKCSMMEQKELDGGLQDKECGRDAPDNMAGICELHYKEYLVALINRHGIDPVDLMNINEMKIVYTREAKEIPLKNPGETDEQYMNRVKQHIRAHIPLPIRKDRLQPQPLPGDFAQENAIINAHGNQEVEVDQYGYVQMNSILAEENYSEDDGIESVGTDEDY